MKAVVYEKLGPPGVLEFREVERPVPADQEILIKGAQKIWITMRR